MSALKKGLVKVTKIRGELKRQKLSGAAIHNLRKAEM